jgi:hypothetical protein
MIWHIFKKDWKLLWHFTLGFAIVQCVKTILLYKVDRGALTQLIETTGWLAGGLLVAAVVHGDAIPGVRQDWLVRPVRRRDLIAAKLLFVILCVGVPIFATSWAGAAAHGFAWNRSLSAAFGFTATQLSVYYFPLLGFASLTRNAIETIAGIAIGAAAFVLLNQAASTIGGLHSILSIRTGADWIENLAATLILVSGAAGILCLQYFRRKTLWARGAAGLVGLLAAMVLTMTPWGPVFAIEKHMSPAPGSASMVSAAFQPERGRYAERPGATRRWESAGTWIYLPIGIGGLPADHVLRVDWISSRLVGEFGSADLGRALGERRYTAIDVPDKVYARLRDKPVRLEIEYSLTVLGLAASHAIPVTGSEEMAPDVGQCWTTINATGEMVEVRCRQAGLAPSCIGYFLEHVPSGRRNPETQKCDANYAPFFAQLELDALQRFGTALPFRDPSGLVHFPVDGPQLRESRVVMRIYQAKEHFTRQVVIPDVRLSDWLPQ